MKARNTSIRRRSLSVVYCLVLLSTLASCGKAKSDRQPQSHSDTTDVEQIDQKELVARIATEQGIKLLLDTITLRFSIDVEEYLNKEILVQFFVVQDVYIKDSMRHVVLSTVRIPDVSSSQFVLDLKADDAMVSALLAEASVDEIELLFQQFMGELSGVAITMKLSEARKIDWRYFSELHDLDVNDPVSNAVFTVEEGQTFYASGTLVAVHELKEM